MVLDAQIAFYSAIVGFGVGLVVATVVVAVIALVGMKDLMGSDGDNDQPAFRHPPVPYTPRWEQEVQEILRKVE